MPGLAEGGELRARIEAVFPTYRDVLLSSDTVAIIWIDPRDCAAADLDARLAKVEAVLDRKVTLRAASEDFRLISAYRHPEVVTTRQLKQVFPSLTVRGNKIGENVEVLVVGAADFNAADSAEKRRKAAAIVGRPVELRLQP
ncbi:hypothetical protein Mrad2831_6301 (plasmid) [Methylobacterium radiotolerans JCM 2831]|uniref:Uncharacterized protein n=2 Tax=Methylobacterium radiotolerans TaxID=31998 RepID=B1M9P8_METRJ|nr:hypothetical protein [Methylobacterium radiotolerans]ACB28223.1 hypothetical protein Mrad2831_6301 [Methylobacterium radiotolerans JCM 2831]GEN01780.1 hypothetical protein MRA01_63190 [Methylobacterium radiotolerans]